MNNDTSEGEYMEQQGHDVDSMNDPIPPMTHHTKNVLPPFRCKIAGIPHRRPDLSVLSIGTEVNLVAEPHNAYDPNAIKIMHNGVHLGYVPKTDTYMVKDVAKMKVVRVDPADKWNEIHIETF